MHLDLLNCHARDECLCRRPRAQRHLHSRRPVAKSISALPTAGLAHRLARRGSRLGRARRRARQWSGTDKSSWEEHYATDYAAISRRSCRQSVAPRGAEGRAREAGQRRDRRRRAQGGRRPRNRKGDQETGRDRAETRHRRRVSPLVVAFRFLQRTRWRHALHHRGRYPVPRRADQAEGIKITGKVGFSGHPHAGAFQVSQRPRAGYAEDDNSGAVDVSFPAGPRFDQQGSLPRDRFLLRRSRQGVSQRDSRVLRRRLPLPATRRYRLVDGVRSERARAVEDARRRSRCAAGTLCAADQRGARRQAGRPGDHHAFVPRQFPLDLHRFGWLRIRRRAAARQYRFRRLFPRIRQRKSGWIRTASLLPEGQESSSCSGWSPRRAASSRTRTTSSAASTRRPNTSRSISSACRRNAASPPPKKATCSPKTSNGRSCG